MLSLVSFSQTSEQQTSTKIQQKGAESHRPEHNFYSFLIMETNGTKIMKICETKKSRTCPPFVRLLVRPNGYKPSI